VVRAARDAEPAEEDLGARATAAAKKAAKTAGRGLSSVAKAAGELSSSAGETYSRQGLNTSSTSLSSQQYLKGHSYAYTIVLLRSITQ
jgi:hypothetical protein